MDLNEGEFALNTRVERAWQHGRATMSAVQAAVAIRWTRAVLTDVILAVRHVVVRLHELDDDALAHQHQEHQTSGQPKGEPGKDR